jgi:hypothetical protein
MMLEDIGLGEGLFADLTGSAWNQTEQFDGDDGEEA